MKIKQLTEGLDAQQRSVPELPAQFRPRKISVLQSKTDPQHPMTGYAVGANESSDSDNDPYDQGWHTGHRRGQDDTACPYKPGTPEHAQWMAGYREARAQPGHYDESDNSKAPNHMQEALSIESDKNYKAVGDYKNYPLYVRTTPFVKNITKEKFFIAQTQIGKEEFKAKGDTADAALQSVKDKIDNILNVSTKVSGSAILDFNVKFATDILSDPREKFFAKIINVGNEPKLIIAGTEMLAFGKELTQLGFKPSALRQDPETDSAVALPSISYTKNQIANTGLIANARYEIADMYVDKDGNKIFNLKYHSTVHTKSDKIRLSRPGLTVGTTRTTNEDITKEDIISKLKDRLGDYLSDISKEIKRDPDLVDKLAAKAPGSQMGPPVKTVTTDDGHEIQIHGNEDDGFRVSVKNKTANSKFNNLDEAVMACEMYCARRRGPQDYLDEAGKDACYNKVKSRYKIWPSAYASGALVRCRKVGAANWGNKSKK